MRSINRIEIFANGSIIAPCHLFSMGHDIHSSSVFFNRISIRMTLLTGTVFALVFYIYLRRIFSYEKLVHQAELFRHNWAMDTEQKEKQLEVNEKNRMFDTSLLDINIDDSAAVAKSKPTTPTITLEDGDGDEEVLGLLPRDKLAAFPNPVRMRFGSYVLLIFAFIIIWLSLLLEMTLSMTGYNTRHLFNKDNFAFARLLEILKSHRRLFDAKVDMHKCFGRMEELKSSLSSSVMTTLKVFVWERNLSASLIPIIVPIVALAVLIESALQGLLFGVLNHRNRGSDGKFYVYLYSSAFKFLVSFFVFTIFLIIVLFFELFHWRADRHISCPENKFLCAEY